FQAASNALNELGTLKDVITGAKPKLNKQQTAYDYFETLFYGRAQLTVQTPWKTYENMIIDSWQADQSAETTTETTFTVRFKQLRIVQTTTNTGQLIGRIKAQKAPVINQGKQAGKSTLLNIGQGITGTN
ncbi:MAG: hypothetical protein EBX40_08810, partial [Gammaproteobacteria bacterium]|nr:hypothetical protein [Gammaproteobacteria bacterium]